MEGNVIRIRLKIGKKWISVKQLTSEIFVFNIKLFNDSLRICLSNYLVNVWLD